MYKLSPGLLLHIINYSNDAYRFNKNKTNEKLPLLVKGLPICSSQCYRNRGGSRIWLREGPEYFWLIFTDSAQWSHANEVSTYWPGSRAHLRALEALGVFITKYAFSPFVSISKKLFLIQISIYNV